MSQISFDPLLVFDHNMQPLGGIWCRESVEEAARIAREARDAFLRGLRKQYPGQRFKGWALTGQLRKYRSLGVEDGRMRTVYMADAYDMDGWQLKELKEKFLKIAKVSA